MVCVDYPEVKCIFCKQKTQDGYFEFKGKIICDECVYELNDIVNNQMAPNIVEVRK